MCKKWDITVHGESLMETLSKIYWYRVGLGVAAALICIAGWALTNTLFTSIIQGASLAIIFYIITYYILKMKFITKVEKPSQVVKTGIGAYFLTWIISWTLLLSLILSPTVPTAFFTYSPDGLTVTFNATASVPVEGRNIVAYSWNFGDNLGNVTDNPTITHNYAIPGDYTVLLYVTDSYGLISSPYARFFAVENITT
jgi:hypothetical protein